MKQPRMTLYRDALVTLVMAPEAALANPLDTWRCELGCWAVYADITAALEDARALASRDPLHRILIVEGGCARTSRSGWVGGAIERARAHCLCIPGGTIALTLEASRRLDDHAELAPLRSPGPVASADTLWRLVSADDSSSSLRSELAAEPLELFGRDDAARSLAALARPGETSGAPVVITGAMGSGKTALAQRFAMDVLIEDPRAEVWWFELDTTHNTRELARALSTRFGLSLDGEPERWSSRLANMLAERGRHVHMILDEITDLDEDAVAWLERVIKLSVSASWVVLTRRAANSLSGGHVIELAPLSHEDSVGVITSHHHGRSDFSLELAERVASQCAGHPGSLVLVGLDAAREGVSPSDKLAAALEELPELPRAILDLYAVARANPDVELLASALDRSVEVINDALVWLERRGWLRSITATSKRSLPPMFRAALVASLGERGEELRGAWLGHLMSRVGGLLDDLDASARGETIAALRGYELELDDLIRWGARGSIVDTCALVANLRYYFLLHTSSFDYLPMIERAQVVAREHGLDVLWQELELSRVIALEYTSGDTANIVTLFEERLEVASTMNERYAFDACYYYAAQIEDTLDRPEQVERALGLLERSLQHVDADRAPGKAAMCHELQARFYFQRGDADAGFASAQIACEHATRASSPTRLGVCLFTLHRALMERGERAEALAAAHRAIANMTAASFVSGLVMCQAAVGYVYALDGDGRAAVPLFRRALTLARQHSSVHGQMNCTFLLGTAHLVEQDYEAARGYFDAAMETYRELELEWNIHQTRMMMGLVHAACGEPELAERCATVARDFFSQSPNPGILYTMEVLEFAPQIYRLGHHGDLDGLSRVREQLLAIEVPNQGGRGLDLGLMLGFIDKVSSEVAVPDERRALRCKRDGSMFILPDQTEPVELARRRTVKRVLAALIEHRLGGAGEVIEAHELFEAAWSAQSFDPRSGLMRLYVTINTLRKLGLSELLQTHGDGYRLDPNVPLVIL